ncbi:MAG: hypothetical protein GQ527_05855 [Bacteroidales bacterium]|nr:hypothetical protein [Bacteroidales bacterium]
MKKTISIVIATILLSFVGIAQISSITTSVQSALQNKFKTFIILDEATGYVLAKTPTFFDAGKEMPLNYFTMVLPSGISKYIPGNPRVFIIHSLQTSGSSGEQDWVLESNDEEKDIFFARNKYIKTALSKHWMIMIDGERVVFKNMRTNEFLSIDKDGKYFAVSSFAEAIRWKLIHSF